MHKNEKESKQQGKGSFAYAFVLDEGAEERARGVTMTVAVAHFETPKLRVVLLDAPGHRDFVPNMISGASQADAAILVVDASIGAFEAGLEGEGQGRGQTREHAQLVRSLGVEQLIVAVNKLDAVDFSKERFDFIKGTLQPFLKQCGFKDGSLQWVPVSAGEGQNLTMASTEPALKAWYNGPCLIELVDSLKPPPRLVARPLRLTIAEVMKTRTLGPSAFGGKLESGAIHSGTKVRVMPSGEIATVKSIELQGQQLKTARAGEGVDVGLNGIDPGMLAPGGVVCHPDYPVPVATRFEVQLLTLDIRTPILKGSQVILHVHHARQPARVDQLVSLLDPKKGTVLRQRPRHLTANQSAIVVVVPDEGVCIEKYSDFRALGRIALREGGKTIAVGIVTNILERK
jgi:elongation factor 1 alpha-like protein